MVGRRDADGIDLRIANDFEEIKDSLAILVAVDADLRAVRILPLDAVRRQARALAVQIADRDDAHGVTQLLAELVFTGKLRDERRTHLNAVTDHRDAALFARFEGPQPGLAGRTARKRHRGRRTEKEVSSIEVHFFFILSLD